MNNYVQFRHIHMACCGTLICWVNSRRPNYCPECGKFIFVVFPRIKWDAIFSSAWLKIENERKAQYLCEEVKLNDDLKQIIIDYHNEEKGE